MDHYVFIPEAEDLREYQIPETEHHHLRNVLRAQLGDELFVLNGRGRHFRARLSNLAKKASSLEVTELIGERDPAQHQIQIAVAPTKNIDRFEFMVEKLAEIGVHRISPILCDRSERKNLRIDRLQKIAISAMKQSRSFYQLEIDELRPLNALDIPNESLKLIAHCDESAQRSYLNSVSCPDHTCLLIGPEGDFTETEIQFAVEKGFIPISFGEKRLRTETAAIFAASVMKSNLDDE